MPGDGSMATMGGAGGTGGASSSIFVMMKER